MTLRSNFKSKKISPGLHLSVKMAGAECQSMCPLLALLLAKYPHTNTYFSHCVENCCPPITVLSLRQLPVYTRTNAQPTTIAKTRKNLPDARGEPVLPLRR